MKKHSSVRFAVLSCGFCLGIAATSSALAADGPVSPPSIVQPAVTPTAAPLRDVKLSTGGRLEGVLIDRQGAPRAAVPVTLLRNDQEVVTTVTDTAGRFAITGLRGGEYVLAVGDEATRCRLWSEGAAPPSAQETLQVYGGDLARGQHYRARNFLTSPAVIGTAIGTAVAVPLALHNREPAS